MVRSRGVRILLSLGACVPVLAAALAVGTAQTAAAAAAVPACTGEDLSATVYPLGGAGGTLYGDVRLTDTTGHRCGLDVRAHSMYFTSDGHAGRIGAWGAYAFETVYPGTGAAARKHFDLSAHGGHVYIRIGIVPADDFSSRSCRPVEVDALVVHVAGSRGAIRAALPVGSLPVCSSTRIRALDFGQYRTHRSTGAGLRETTAPR